MKFLTWQNPEQLIIAQVLIKILNNSVAEFRLDMIKFKSYFFALVMGLCIASCGGDGDDNDGGGNDNTGGNTETPVKPDKMSLTVTLNEPGTLVEKIDATKKYTTASLKVVGKINGTDILFLRDMAGGDVKGKPTNGNLAYLDLSDAQIVHGGKAYLNYQKIDLYLTEDNTIPAGMFYGCVSLIKVYLPNSVTKMEGNIFYGCNAIENIYLPSSLKKIEGDPFYTYTRNPLKADIANLKAWNDIDMSKRNSNISEYVTFTYKGKEITELTVPSGIKELSSNYMLISQLTMVNVPGTVKKIGNHALSSTKLKKITLSNGIEEFGDYAFADCKKITSLQIPTTVKNIGQNCFRGCTGLTEIKLPNSVETLGAYAFSDCTSLTVIDLSSTKITQLYTSTFSKCSSLKDLKLPNGLMNISESAFWSATGLKTLTIPASVTYIGDHAFLSCDNMLELHMKSKTAPKYGGNSSSLGFGARKIDIYVPKGCKEAYNKQPWKSHNIIEE